MTALMADEVPDRPPLDLAACTCAWCGATFRYRPAVEAEQVVAALREHACHEA